MRSAAGLPLLVLPSVRSSLVFLSLGLVPTRWSLYSVLSPPPAPHVCLPASPPCLVVQHACLSLSLLGCSLLESARPRKGRLRMRGMH